VGEKYKDVDMSDESSSEEEDDFGVLVTEDVEAGIGQVLDAIRNDPSVLLNRNRKFFPDIKDTAGVAKTEKPLYLKDYHRMNLLNEGDNDDEKPYAIQQKEERDRLVAEIHEAGNEDESEDGFLTQRTVERKVESVELPDPESDEKGFLEAFISKQAWIPHNVDAKTGKNVVPSYGELVEEDDEEFDDIADQFETAYNFRYEDPNASEIVSYARNQSTLRRTEESSRRKQRERKAEAQTQHEEQHKAEIKRLKKNKVNQVLTRFEKLKEALEDEEVAGMFTEQDLEGEFDSTEWDKRMQAVFNEEFYSKKDNKFKDQLEDGDYVEEETNQEEEQDEEDARGRSKLEKQEKTAKKKEKKRLREAAEQFVEDNLELAVEEAGLDRRLGETKFRYRDVSPDSFGLSARDILLADDKELNEFVGLKKLASFRDPQKKQHDKKKYAKKRRLREWRKSVFDTEEVDDELFQRKMMESEQPKKKKKGNN
jgi:protein KRI1